MKLYNTDKILYINHNQNIICQDCGMILDSEEELDNHELLQHGFQ